MHKSIMIENEIPLVDEDQTTGLELYCHTKSIKNDPSLFACRGIVFEKDKEEHYMLGVPYCTEYHDEEDYNKYLKPYYEYDIYDSHEGTIIRVFFYKDTWYTSTHRKLDAFKSKWASPHTTFGQSFAKHMRTIFPNDDINDDKKYLVSVYDAHFNRDHQYIFLLKPSEEERIVCKPVKKDVILHIATVVNGDIQYDATVHHIPKPFKHIDIETPSDIDRLLFSIYETELQGVLLIHKTTGNHIKIYTRRYKQLFDARGNIPSIRYRYYQLLCDGDDKTIMLLRHLYPYIDFNKIHTDLDKACTYLHHKYIDRYIYKEHVTLDSPCHYVLCAAHEIYKDTHKPITVHKIRSIVTRSPTLINKVVKYYQLKMYESRHEKR